MKHLFLFLLFIPFASYSQDFAFEEPTVPTEWVVNSGGVLSISTEHYKDYSQSLCWTTTGTSVLTVSFPIFTANTGNAAFMQVYSPALTNDTLKLEFLYNGLVKRTAQFCCNFKGWRELNRTYTEYPSVLSSGITSVRMTLKPSCANTRKIYFDQVNFNAPIQTGHLIGSQWILDKNQFTANNASLNLFANIVDITTINPTSQELADLASLRNSLRRTPVSGTISAVNAAKNYANLLNIIRNTDGSVRGNTINTATSALTSTFITDLTTKLEVLAAAAQNDVTTKILFQKLVDHILDQGIAEGCNFQIISSDYTPARAIPAKLLNILPACTDAQKIEIVKLVRWISYYGNIYNSSSNYLSQLNSDLMYLFLPHMMGVALNQSDDAVAVRELKALKRFLERNTEYVPGGNDILKPDGTGFHHGTHYNNYMYAYRTWVEYLNYVKGTQFKISPEAYARMKKAVISVYCMATLDTGDSRHYANTLSGRNPFEAGIQMQFTKDLFEKLIAVGGDCLGKQDDELAAAYNYFFQSTKYSVTSKKYEGFYQFNYSPTGIYRKNNWVATMHAPTSNFWGAEIYNNANRFGRYQSHGALEITYGGTPANSGYPTNSTGGGWDWNIVPGATTVHYTSWTEMMPYGSETGRFDQRTKTKNFSGALSWGDCGMFSCDFDQMDTWSGSAFTATNLAFKKSMFAFDNMIFSLGSNIGSSGNYANTMITATNLFQNIISTVSGNLILNGTIKTKPYSESIATTEDNWLINPQGTGYFIPKGNDAIVINYNDQSTPGESGADYASPLTTSPAAKAYINHGIKPSGKNYSYVLIPATTSLQMQNLATQMANGGGSIYQVLAQTASVHALRYIPQNITAYSFFGANSNLSFGIVKSTTSEHLLMDKKDAVNNRHYFAICNPNLHPQSNPTYGWIATASQTTLTLTGEWLPISTVSGVVFSTPVGGQTQITITMQEGEPIYFGVKAAGDTTGINEPNTSNWVDFSKQTDELLLTFADKSNENTQIQILSTNGQICFQKSTSKQDQRISIRNFPKGIYFCTISGTKGKKTIRFQK